MFLHACMMLKSYRIFSTKLMHYISIPAWESRLPIHLTIYLLSNPTRHDFKTKITLHHHSSTEAIRNLELYQFDILYHVGTSYQPTEKEHDGSDYLSVLGLE
ncbi:hypothetical protein AVEN_130261-1 [Araneus ventricosus]|uniref:Uncharacterized protein n=1 Tax=Araneus ventricosus TaxID=182803 RepID=A0A4Y2FPF8_ARAVE|nr:hypothetical protein AVEN_130261-1 [Araneus ventricosus]